jgi:hypothetical protein
MARNCMHIDEKSNYDRRIELLIRRLPERWQNMMRRIRSGQARWWRIVIGILLCLSAFFWFLPILGLWMLPLGMVLLAEDIPFIGGSTIGHWGGWKRSILAG